MNEAQRTAINRELGRFKNCWDVRELFSYDPANPRCELSMPYTFLLWRPRRGCGDHAKTLMAKKVGKRSALLIRHADKAEFSLFEASDRYYVYVAACYKSEISFRCSVKLKSVFWQSRKTFLKENPLWRMCDE